MKSIFSKNTALILIGASPFHAATKTWDGGAATANWSDAANWNADGTPTSSDAVLLDNSTVNPLPNQRAIRRELRHPDHRWRDQRHLPQLRRRHSAVTHLYGASVDAANTGPLIHITATRPRR